MNVSMKSAVSGVKLIVAGLGLTGILAGCGVPFHEKDLVGQWNSPSCESATGGDGNPYYYTRSFDLTEESWSIDFVLFGDSACTVKLSTATIGGAYELLENSETVEGARLADFQREILTVTAHTADMAGYFESSGCGTGTWSVDVSMDVASTGCAPLGLEANTTCPTEFDLVKLEGDSLYFGDRSAGMCDEAKRTTSVQSVPVVRQ